MILTIDILIETSKK